MSSKPEVLMAETKLPVFWTLLPEEKTQVPLHLVCVCVCVCIYIYIYTTSHGITPQKTVMFTVMMFHVALKAQISLDEQLYGSQNQHR